MARDGKKLGGRFDLSIGEILSQVNNKTSIINLREKSVARASFG